MRLRVPHLKSQFVSTEQAHRNRNGREYQEEHGAEHDRADDQTEQQPKPHPQLVQRQQKLGTHYGDHGKDHCQQGKRGADFYLATPVKIGEHYRKYCSEKQTELAVRRKLYL